jgi:hypothetical protein
MKHIGQECSIISEFEKCSEQGMQALGIDVAAFKE